MQPVRKKTIIIYRSQPRVLSILLIINKVKPAIVKTNA